MQVSTAQISDHVLVYLSVLYGAAVATTMAGSGFILRNRERIRRPALTVLWSLTLYMQITQNWWPLWTWADYMAADFLRYFLIGLVPTIFCLAAALLHPSRLPDDGLDLREFFLRNRFAFLGCMLLLQGLAGANTLLMHGTPPDLAMQLTVRGVVVVALVILVVTRRPGLHLLGASLMLAGTAGWAFLFTWSYS